MLRSFFYSFLLLMSASSLALAAPAIESQSTAKGGSENGFGILHNIGFQLGTNINTVSVTSLTPAPVTNGRTRFMFGANANIGLGSIFYLQPELNYVQRGYEEPSTNGTDRIVTAVEYDTLEIPLLVKVRTGGNGKVRPFAIAGPGVGILLTSSADTTITTANGSASVVSDKQRADAFSLFSVNLNFGAGVDFDLSQTTAAFFNLRYSLALTNSESAPLASDTPTRTIRDNAVQLVAGLQFGL